MVVKLGIKNPDSALIDKYLQAIADIYKIPWGEEAEENAGAGTGGGRSSDIPPPPYTPGGNAPTGGGGGRSDDADFDELAKRFEALKNRK